jgi:hypothetical protein
VTGFAVPPGDPDTVRAAAAQLGGLAAGHAAQLQSFRSAVKTLLATWRSGVAEQYAVAAGQACGRFTATCQALKTAQSALNAYASALESAQAETRDLNAAFAAASAPAGGRVTPAERVSASLAQASFGQQAQDTLTTLRAAENACARALDSARSALATSCPDTLTAGQLLAAVRAAALGITSGATVDQAEYLLSSWALYDFAAKAAGGVQAGEALRESTQIAGVLGQEEVSAAVEHLLEQVKDPLPLLMAWQAVTATAQAEENAAQAAVDLKGGNLWEGMLNGGRIAIEEPGAHAAAQSALDVFLRTSKLDVSLAGLSIVFGLHDLLDPGDGPGWEQTGTQVAGGASALGGGGQVLSWAIRAELVDWDVPYLDAGTALLIGGAAIWSLGDLAYNSRHAVGSWFDDATSWAGQVGEDVWHAPQEFAGALESAVNPLDW